jgi:DNA-binding IclR family transcriptional regulator
MARPSPGTQRVIALLNFYADHPGQAFSLTDLIRALKINRATCHSLLAELVDAGYLYRTNDKRYLLGPAMVRFTRLASLQLSPLQVALPEMRALSDRHDVVCLAVFRDGGDAVAREQTSSLSHLSLPLARGMRWPLRPPFGAIFLAWSPPDEAAAWLDSLAPPPSDAERQRTFEGMAFAREHGFQFVVKSVSDRRLEKIDEWLFLQDPAERPIQPSISLDPQQTYPLTGMSAPVFDREGRVAFVISLSGFAGMRIGAEVAAIAAEVRAACQRVTQFFAEAGEG